MAVFILCIPLTDENGNCEAEKKQYRLLGHKCVPSREDGIEIVVEELSTGMAANGSDVTLYNRGGHHVSGKEFDSQKLNEYKGVKLKSVPTIDRKGLAAVSSSFFGAIKRLRFQIHPLWRKQAVKYADEIIVLSKGVQKYFRDEYGRKTVLIPNGVNRPDIVEAKEITERWGLKQIAI